MENFFVNESQPDWKYVDIEKVCRICLQEDNDLLLIFEDINSYKNILLADIITECSSCAVERHDFYPDQICLKCLENLKISYDFRIQCKSSHKKIKLVLNNGKESLIPIIDSDIPSSDKFTQTEAYAFFPCEKCEEKFITIEKLRTHRYYNHKGTRNECRICKKTFLRIGYLKSHLSLCHPEFGYTNHNECIICNKKFSRAHHLRRHLKKIHNKKVLLKIEPQNKSEELEGDLIKNEDKNEDKNEKHVCDVCNMKFETKEILKSHSCNQIDDLTIIPSPDITNIQKHDDEYDDNKITENVKSDIESDDNVNNDDNTSQEKISLDDSNEIEKSILEEISIIKENTEESKNVKKTKSKNTCSICGKLFSRPDHVRRHERTHINPKPYECIYCEKSFSRTQHLNNHVEKCHSEKQTHKCNICSKGFLRFEHLKRHKEQKVCNEKVCNEKVPKEKKPKTFPCTICNKKFTTEKYYNIHVASHNSKTFTCKFCPMVQKSKAESLQHLKTHDNQKPFLCSECGLRFVRNDYLLVHMRRHNGEKPYKCKFCDKGFPRATDLTVHERYHTGEKTHLCVTCGKGFQRAYNLVVHMRVHTGERPYKCPHCARCFAQGNDLKAHIRRHTGERFRCEICNEGFIQGYHLTQHKKAIHNIDQPSHIRRVEKIKPPSQQTQMKDLIIELVQEDTTTEESTSTVKNEPETNTLPEITTVSNVDKLSITDEPIYFATINEDSIEIKYEASYE